jgi:histone-lysine N-methyltransferase SETD2
MAGVMVQCLNPYRKPDCKSARICSTEDFKHLARKVMFILNKHCSIKIKTPNILFPYVLFLQLTHFVMLKELKHCRNVSDLVCNDNVKHKARDFVKKYMAKFGVTYQREAEN